METPYFKSLTISEWKCFGERAFFDFTGKEGLPSQWTVILGDNNTGKTTLLRILAEFETMLLDNNTKNPSNNPALRFPQKMYMPKFLHNNTLYDSQSTFSLSADLWIKGKSLTLNCEKPKIEKGLTMGMVAAPEMQNFKVHGYGVTRRSGNKAIEGKFRLENSATLFDSEKSLINVNEWLLQIDFAVKNGAKGAKNRNRLIKKALFDGVLPDIQDYRVLTDEKLNSYVEFRTANNWVTLNDIGYGYQASLAWIADFMKCMFERYPDSKNPLAEPAILLVDEIDLHLHPAWQRKIIKYLTNIFERTQFIVTTHSPILVQSVEEVNLIVLKKHKGLIHIEQPKIPSLRGWTIEEILSEFMELDGHVMSQQYIYFLNSFDKALDEGAYNKAKDAYQELSKILHPQSHQHKLLRLQLNQIKPT